MCREKENLDQLFNGKNGWFVTKSCTEAQRSGNPSPRYATAPYGSINSMGLPNNGAEFYIQYIETTQRNEKPVFLSVSGLSTEENKAILRLAEASPKVLAVELNLSCPNVVGKPQIGYEFEDMKRYLSEASEIYSGTFGIKLPPYFDMVHFDMAAEIINSFKNISFVTCINSIGNGLLVNIDTEEVFIKPKGGFGGIGGKYVLPTALANVHRFYQLLSKEKSIVGCGGVVSGEDVFAHILCGASAVQVGTHLYENGISVFKVLLKEFEKIMEKKGYQNIESFRGKLKAL